MPRKQLYSDYEKLLLKNIRLYSKRVQRLYYNAITEVSLAASTISYRSDAFTLDDYPALKTRIDQVLREMQREMTATVQRSVAKTWGLANKKNDRIAREVLGRRKLPQTFTDLVFDPNEAALKAFTQRRENGLNLARRVWKLIEPFKHELEAGLADGIGKGRSAASMARVLKQHLNEPDKLFRRVRDKDGKLQLSKAAQAYTPGPGVYRSSYKNALRLTRTETNMAYRNADLERWRNMPFVLGYEVKLSLMHPKFDICDLLAGPFPKNFNWAGWHPHCLCYAVPILADAKDVDKMEDYILGLTDKPPGYQPIQGIPDQLTEWLIDNRSRMEGWKKAPWWVRDNPGFLIQDDVERLMLRARAVGDEVDGLGQRYARKYDGTVTPINFKKRGSLTRKAANYGGDLGEIKDAVRNTVIVTLDKLDQVVQVLRQDPQFIRVKVQEGPEYFGYKGVITNVQTRTGLIGEMQVNTPGMIYAKSDPDTAQKLLGMDVWNAIADATGLPGGLGHKLYEKIRLLKPGENDALLADLIRQSEEYYRVFYRF